MNCKILPEVDLEVLEAARWYDAQRPGLGDEFVDELQVAVARVRTAPFELGHLESYSGRHKIRRCLLKRFPYVVIFRTIENGVEVIAVAHVRRKPLFWAARLER